MPNSNVIRYVSRLKKRHETLYNKLRALSDKDLELLTLLCVDGFQQADIARRMNCSRNAVHKRLKKIKKILKKG